MNKKYDDDFFDELDKTTDLLKAFKPHIENNSVDSLESLYSEFNINKSKNTEKDKKLEQKEYLVTDKNNDENKFLKETYEKQKNKESLKDQEQLVVEKEKFDFSSFEIEEDISFNEEVEEKTDISEIIDKMNIETTKKKQRIEVKKQETKLKKNKDKKAKFNFFEIAFVCLSFVFIISCIFLYGLKLMDKEETETKKLTLLSASLTKSSNLTTEGDGLYKDGNNYVYKGQDVNNYVSYSNMLWRIIKKNSDGTIDMITEEYMHTLSWNGAVTSYIETDIHAYLNNDFINILEKSYLDKVDICLDDVDNVNVINCTNVDSNNYVRLLTVDEYLNSKLDYTYVAPLTDTLWLGNKSYSKVWQVAGNEVVLNIPTKPLGIKPVVKLHKNVAIVSGDGTKDNPYTLGL